MKNLSKLNTSKYFLPYDVYERHKKIGSLISQLDTVLDVGGELNHLSQFCRPRKIIVANLTSGDVIIQKDRLPFKNSSFSVVCAIDVLEHIQKKNRPKFINELIKVSSKKVILSFPMGTKRHIEYETQIQKWLTLKNIDVGYLKEHIRHGLPSKDEILKLTNNLERNIFYSGNLTINKFLFRIFLFDPQTKYIRKLVFLLKIIFNFLTNPIIYFFISNKLFGENINRAYVVLKKKNQMIV